MEKIKEKEWEIIRFMGLLLLVMVSLIFLSLGVTIFISKYFLIGFVLFVLGIIFLSLTFKLSKDYFNHNKKKENKK